MLNVYVRALFEDLEKFSKFSSMYCLSSFAFLSPNILYWNYLFIQHTINKPTPLNTIANENYNITVINCAVNNDGLVPDDFSGQSGGDALLRSTESGTELDGN